MIRVRLCLIALGCAVGGWVAFTGTGSALAPIPKERTTPYVKWSVTSDHFTNEMLNPLVVKEFVVVGTNQGELRAYRTGNGEPVWTYQHGSRLFHKLSSDGERVYFSAHGGLTAVTADAGEKVWAVNLVQGEGPVLALPEKGLVLIADNDGTLHALEAKTGKKRWDAEFLTDAPAVPPMFGGKRLHISNDKAFPTCLVNDGEMVILSVFDQCRIVSFNVASGKKLWSFQTSGCVYGEAVATSNHVFIGSQDEAFYCLDKKTGKQVWKFVTKARVASGGVVDDRYVYFGSCDGGLYCLSQADGKLRWRFEADRFPDGSNSAIYSVPVLRQGTLYFAAGEGQFYAVAADSGALRWKLRPAAKSEMYCSPATDGRSYFVTTRPGRGLAGEQPGVSMLAAISLR